MRLGHWECPPCGHRLQLTCDPLMHWFTMQHGDNPEHKRSWSALEVYTADPRFEGNPIKEWIRELHRYERVT